MSNNPKHKNIVLKCFAKTRKGGLCQSLAVSGKKRCRMHGGAKGSGAPKGNQNALKHGCYSKEAIINRKEATAVIKKFKAFLNEITNSL